MRRSAEHEGAGTVWAGVGGWRGRGPGGEQGGARRAAGLTDNYFPKGKLGTAISFPRDQKTLGSESQ